jgi:hypothetical protein
MRESLTEKTIRTRPSARLNAKLEKSLLTYATAASAAGVGLLALSQPVEGKVIFTKAHQQIGVGATLPLDLNHDGVTDFNLKDTYFASGTPGTFINTLSLAPAAQGNNVWGHTVDKRGYASALYAGVLVGPKGRFLAGTGLMANNALRASSCLGPWADVKNRYLGFKFAIKGQAHFGWARLNVGCSSQGALSPLLTGYAYETVAGRPIFTGKSRGRDEWNRAISAASSGTLGRLAQGSNMTRKGR